MVAVSSNPLDIAEAWLAQGRRLVLATVIETWGSAPTPIGSHLVIAEGGDFSGSVSGGCVEGDVIAEAETMFGSENSKVLRYGVADKTAWQVGLSCGGKIKVLLSPVNRD